MSASGTADMTRKEMASMDWDRGSRKKAWGETYRMSQGAALLKRLAVKAMTMKIFFVRFDAEEKANRAPIKAKSIGCEKE